MPNSEIIELLTRLREIEPERQSIVDRCDAVINDLKWIGPSLGKSIADAANTSPNAKAWNTTVAGRILPGGENQAGPWALCHYGNVVFVR